MSEWTDEAIDRLEEAMLDDLAGDIVYQNRHACCWYGIGVILAIALILGIVVMIIQQIGGPK